MINGELIDLRAGNYEARVATSGATLVHLRHEGRDLVVPFDAARELPLGWQGKTLVPWPNRIAGARYTHRGVDYLVPCNEPETGSALHGLVGWADFRPAPVDRDGPGAEPGDEAVLELTLPGSYAYPWSLAVRVRFCLDAEEGLSIEVTSTNLGAARAARANAVGAAQVDGAAAPAPYGVSIHPYLTRSVPLDECVLELPASRVLDTDERMAPAGLRPVEGTEWDWRSGRRVGATSTDNAYTGLPAGAWQARLTGGPTGRSVVMTSSAPWVQAYSGEHLGRAGVAIEPMTCPPNAFNSGEGLVELEQGASHTLRCTLREEG
ncbi:MAG: aldose 1-epimerase family protein [Actinomyces sp.]|uniref:aldose 1-epimerase family protein n=1 Tax=Actinomyces sp. TaxID=29317 RepID=UPI0026DC5121|nr:aldose 1-epimerase family protein [Actinomyces sp.]MDO4242936.1 aldose 1-epimerase family protein [Actinomyces sp.]